MATFDPRDIPETPELDRLHDAFYREIFDRYTRHMEERVYEEVMSAARNATTATVTETEDDDDDAALERLGINIRPRPQQVESVNATWETWHDTVIGDGNVVATAVAVDLSNATIRGTSIQNALDSMDSLAITGTMSYNGEELESLIRRIVREELHNRREE